MTVELGHLALILAFLVAVVQMVVPMVGAARGWADWMRLAVPAAVVQFALTLAAFASLMRAFAVSDFSVELVALNSHSAKPLIYKLAGTWGNHEGSMLLWMLILTLFGAMVAIWGGNLPPTLKARVLSVQATIAVAFFGFILLTSNPFARLPNPPFDGNDLNPLLQDPGLAFHPPFLYLGYVGLSMAYSFAIAALIEGRVDAAWARWVRPWTLLAWVFLTIGIAFGSIWAYYELGWGGWWFWDPVENVSFMPWLIAAALLHSAIVVEKRGTLKSWTILLAILAFSFSLIGAFIVRSGILTSVHAFANDPDRGVFLLLILAAFIGGSLTLYAWRAPVLRSDAVFATVSRESGLVLNNLLLVVATFVVFFGTIWPLLAEILTGRKVSVGAPFFDLAFTPFMVALAVVLPVGAVLPWKRGSLKRRPRPDARRAGAGARARRARLDAADRPLDDRARSAPRSPPGWSSAPSPRSPPASASAAPASPNRCAAPATCRAPTGARRSPTPASASPSSASPRSPPGRSRTSAPSAPAKASTSAATSCASTASSAPAARTTRPRPAPSPCSATAACSRPCTPRSGSTTCRAWRRPRRRSTAA